MRSDGALIAGGCLVGIVTILLATILGAFILLWAWNTFMPDVFGLPNIDFWKALALSLMLSSIGRIQVNTPNKG